MAFFMLFSVEKSTNYKEFKQELCQFGDINFFTLKDDINKKNCKFGQLDYRTLSNEAGLVSFLRDKKISFKQKESKKTQNMTQSKVKSSAREHHSKLEISKEITNPSFYFYKDEAYGKGIEKYSLTDTYKELFTIKEARKFELTTLYPGLLVGSGYNHPKLKESDEDFQLGFFFDHTTGLPLISGSSIKGVLRSVLEKEEFVKDVYGLESKEILKRFFEEGEVTFFDAFIIHSANKENQIFGSDYITSHHSDEKDGVFKDPNPIKFLKILSEVSFRFQFQFLKEADEKHLELFKGIILDFGLGAKTNTGYGKFKG